MHLDCGANYLESKRIPWVFHGPQDRAISLNALTIAFPVVPKFKFFFCGLCGLSVWNSQKAKGRDCRKRTRPIDSSTLDKLLQQDPTISEHPESHPTGKRLRQLTLVALGVVYGDIGTSPLYALRECFKPEYGLAANSTNVYGVLSLVVWSLISVVS